MDEQKLQLFSFLVFSKLEGAVTTGMIHLGDKLGLYSAMREAATPLHRRRTRPANRTPRALGPRMGLQPGGGAHHRLRRRRAVLPVGGGRRGAGHARPPRVRHGDVPPVPQHDGRTLAMPESFRTGLGHDYDSHGPEAAVGIERSFEPWNRANLLPVVLPALDGVTERLATGTTVGRRGLRCRGSAAPDGRRLPEQQVRGLRHQPLRAQSRRGEAPRRGHASNVSFHDPREAPLPDDGSIGFITTFDCIHDMTHPFEMMQTLRRAIAP